MINEKMVKKVIENSVAKPMQQLEVQEYEKIPGTNGWWDWIDRKPIYNIPKTLDNVVSGYKNIMNKPFISERTCSSAAGELLDNLMKAENKKSAKADFGFIEYKTQFSGNEVKFFTHKFDSSKSLEFRNNYGYYDFKTGIYRNYARMKTTNWSGERSSYDYFFRLKMEPDFFRIMTKHKQTNKIQEIDYGWKFDDLCPHFDDKMRMVLYSIVDREKINTKNYIDNSKDEKIIKITNNNEVWTFTYKNAYILGGMTSDKFLYAIENGDVIVELNMGTKDRGNAFKMNVRNIFKYYDILGEIN